MSDFGDFFKNWVLPFVGLSLIAVGLLAALAATLNMASPVAGEKEAVEWEPLEPSQWHGEVVCSHTSVTLLSVTNLADFHVAAREAGWMWELIGRDGSVITYQQPAGVVCMANSLEE